MIEEKKVLVYEGNDEKEIENIRLKLENAGIKADFEDSPMAFPFPKDQNSLKLKVDILEEKTAFKIIDKHIQG